MPEHITPLEEVIESITLREDETTRALEKLLGKLKFDDALIWRRFRVEWLSLDTGLKHFALYHDGQPFVVVDVRSDELLLDIRLRLASVLAWLGFQPDQVEIRPFEALAVPTRKLRLPRLFDVVNGDDDDD